MIFKFVQIIENGIPLVYVSKKLGTWTVVEFTRKYKMNFMFNLFKFGDFLAF